MLDSAILCYGAYRKQVNIIIGILIVLVFYLSFLREDIITDSSAVPNLHTAPPPKRDFLQGKSEIFEQLLTRNVSTFTENELSFFLSFKESQYRNRRVKIKEYCDKKGNKFGKKKNINNLI